MSEFGLIEIIRQRASSTANGYSTTDKAGDGVRLGIGDDAALVEVPFGHELVVTTDTLNSGIHFDPEVSAADIGHKALAVNLSDLAAMGASPRWVLLSISMPDLDQQWLEEFVDGFFSLADEAGVILVGGDTCSGGLSISVTAMGLVPGGQAITRAGGRPDDLVVVSGSIGDAALALLETQKGGHVHATGLIALHRPLPRIALGSSLVGKASACIDISDGLLADLGHVAKASGCAAIIELDRLPTAAALRGLNPEERWKLQLAGGDDYELCFTIPPGTRPDLPGMASELEIDLTVVGKLTQGDGIRCLAADGSEFEMQSAGYEHFK
jgi:thiamine-monophosphate kinase